MGKAKLSIAVSKDGRSTTKECSLPLEVRQNNKHGFPPKSPERIETTDSLR